MLLWPPTPENLCFLILIESFTRKQLEYRRIYEQFNVFVSTILNVIRVLERHWWTDFIGYKWATKSDIFIEHEFIGDDRKFGHEVLSTCRTRAKIRSNWLQSVSIPLIQYLKENGISKMEMSRSESTKKHAFSSQRQKGDDAPAWPSHGHIKRNTTDGAPPHQWGLCAV